MAKRLNARNCGAALPGDIPTRRIELVYFEGCPNVPAARKNLQGALRAVGRPLEWSETDLGADSTPEDFRRYASPTVLVDGEDVTGSPCGEAVACRNAGAPSVEAIVEKLRRPTEW